MTLVILPVVLHFYGARRLSSKKDAAAGWTWQQRSLVKVAAGVLLPRQAASARKEPVSLQTGS